MNREQAIGEMATAVRDGSPAGEIAQTLGESG